MTFRDFMIALCRKPWVALIVAGLCALWGVREVSAPPVYEERCVITLLTPPAPFPRNAYASFTPGLVMMAEVSARTAGSPEVRQAVREAGGTGDYQVVLANRGSQEVPIHDQPYLWLSATSTNPAEAQRTMTAALRVLRQELRTRQRSYGAAPNSLITWRVTGGTGRPVPLTGRPSRQYLAFGILTVLFTCYAAVLADRRGLRLPLPGRRRMPAPG
jgi:hypothetical protein